MTLFLDPDRDESSFAHIQFDVVPPNSSPFNIIFETEAIGSKKYLIVIDNLNIEEGSCVGKITL